MYVVSSRCSNLAGILMVSGSRRLPTPLLRSLPWRWFSGMVLHEGSVDGLCGTVWKVSVATGTDWSIDVFVHSRF